MLFALDCCQIVLTSSSTHALEPQEEQNGAAAGKLSVALLEVNTCALKLYMCTTALGGDGHNMAATANSQVCTSNL